MKALNDCYFPATPPDMRVRIRRFGFELSHIALNTRAIDFAKFGQLFLDGGKYSGKQIISEEWVKESTAPDRNDRHSWKTYPEWAEASGYYKYFWWGDTNGSGDYVYSAIGR